ncbi:hypothetical protein ACGFNU_21060 [Spirillospora sp. NPDC048911]
MTSAIGRRQAQYLARNGSTKEARDRGHAELARIAALDKRKKEREQR